MPIRLSEPPAAPRLPVIYTADTCRLELTLDEAGEKLFAASVTSCSFLSIW
jgi:hypothetical protein